MCSEGEEREAGRTLGPAVPLGGGERGETNVCVSLPFLAWWPGSCSLCSVLRCSLVGGGPGAETLLRREEKDGAERPGSPAGPLQRLSSPSCLQLSVILLFIYM